MMLRGDRSHPLYTCTKRNFCLLKFRNIYSIVQLASAPHMRAVSNSNASFFFKGNPPLREQNLCVLQVWEHRPSPFRLQKLVLSIETTDLVDGFLRLCITTNRQQYSPPSSSRLIRPIN